MRASFLCHLENVVYRLFIVTPFIYAEVVNMRTPDLHFDHNVLGLFGVDHPWSFGEEAGRIYYIADNDKYRSHSHAAHATSFARVLETSQPLSTSMT